MMNRPGSNLFNYDQGACARRLLAPGAGLSSKVEYDEYVVFGAGFHDDEEVNAEEDDDAISQNGSIGMRSTVNDNHIAHRFSCDQNSGAQMLDMAFRAGHEIDKMVSPRVARKGVDELMV